MGYSQYSLKSSVYYMLLLFRELFVQIIKQLPRPKSIDFINFEKDEINKG